MGKGGEASKWSGVESRAEVCTVVSTVVVLVHHGSPPRKNAMCHPAGVQFPATLYGGTMEAIADAEP